MNRRALTLPIVAAFTSAVVLVPYTLSAQPACWPGVLPVGQSTVLLQAEPQQAVWCVELGLAPTTRAAADNTWVDDFDTNVDMASLEDQDVGYRVFHTAGASTYEDRYFRNKNHWMVDVAGYGPAGYGNCEGCWNFGNTLIRPDRSFTFQADGHLIVEADVAAGQADYAGNAWPEIVISQAERPTGLVDPLYAYGDFSGNWTFGCRLQPSRAPICALYDDTGRDAGAGGRVFEISFFQDPGAQRVFGGFPDEKNGLDAAWRACLHDEPDLWCRDRFRLDLTKDSVTLYVNAVKYFEVAGLPPNRQLPDALTKGPVYVYNASTIYKPYVDGDGLYPVTRFHWDHFAVNPGTPPTASPLYCPDQPRGICGLN